jgi:hypothetical protein
MYRVETGRVEFSTCDRVSMTQLNLLGCFFRNAYTWLFDSLSCAIMTFSLPLMTKYPPWS